MRAARIKVTPSILHDSALKNLNHGHNLDLPGGPVESLVSKYFMQDFIMGHNIVIQSQSGYRVRQPIWERYNDRSVAKYLGEEKTI